MDEQQRDASMSDVKNDLTKLFNDVENVANQALDQASDAWQDTKAKLETQHRDLKATSATWREQGGAAADDIKHGFVAAFNELKQAVTHAREKFNKKEGEAPPPEGAM